MRVTRLASYATLVLISVVGFFALAPTAQAEDVSVTAVVPDLSGPPPDPIVQFSGFAAPGAGLSVHLNGSVITTGTATSSAAFDFLLNDQPAGQQIYEIFAIDTDGRALAPMSFALNLTAGSTTTISGIFLGPSFAIDQSSVALGSVVATTGQTYPGSTVTVSVATSPITTYATIADSAGRWATTIGASDLGVGTYTLYAQASSSIAGVSELSATITLAVTQPSPPTNTNTAPTNTNTTRPPPNICIGKSSADLNCDGRVNLIDLSVLLFYWQQTRPANDRADVSNEGQVGMVDFSIMLFQWTG